jgi:hypothetical protein
LKRLENISYSADSLADVDLLDSRFDFDLSTYVAINTIKATSKCTKKSMIKFPAFLGKTSTINKNKKAKVDYQLSQLEALNLTLAKHVVATKPPVKKPVKKSKK